jgi:mycothiol synthase
MVWPAMLRDLPPRPEVPAGYELRQFREGDLARYIGLMDRAGFKDWTEQRVRKLMESILPGGFLVIEHKATGDLVATALAEHKPQPLHPFGGELGYVAGDPAHRGKGLGLAVCAAAVARLLRAGYRSIYLCTDDHRLAAIKTYLRLGFKPLLHKNGMEDRWRRVGSNLDWELTWAEVVRLKDLWEEEEREART